MHTPLSHPCVASHCPHCPPRSPPTMHTVPDIFAAHCASPALPSVVHGTHVLLEVEHSGAPALVHWLLDVHATHTPMLILQCGVPGLPVHCVSELHPASHRFVTVLHTGVALSVHCPSTLH